MLEILTHLKLVLGTRVHGCLISALGWHALRSEPTPHFNQPWTAVPNVFVLLGGGTPREGAGFCGGRKW